MRFAFAALSLILAVNAGAVVYVDKSSPGGDGSSWGAAFTTLQPAIDAAHAAGGDEVWVAAGDYDEVRTGPDDPTQMPEDGALNLRLNVALYGGFAGDETQRDQRDWATNVTIINGVHARNGQNACHVVYDEEGGLLDGFTITGGNIYSPYSTPCENTGGGLLVSAASPIIRNCTIRDNSVAGSGGGMTIGSPSALIENCSFIHNGAFLGGGVVISGSPTFSKCRFENNGCGEYRSIAAAGGAGVLYSASPLFINCVFNSNTAQSWMRRSLGAAFCLNSNSFPEFRNCTFRSNLATNEDVYNTSLGGAIYSDSTSLPVLTNCILRDNVPTQVSGPAVITYSNVQGGWDGEGNIDEDPLFNDELGRLAALSPCINTALAQSAPADDIRNVPRPVGSGPDMGAYEMVYAKASFGHDKETGIVPFDVQFADLTDCDYIAGWHWDFGDGSTSEEQSPLHRYNSAGTYPVSLTVITCDGSDTKTIEGCVTVYSQALVPSFQMNIVAGRRPLKVCFTDTSTFATPITAWKWTFGDGSTSTEQNPTHIYKVPGTFSVTLQVTSECLTASCTLRDSITVVNKRPRLLSELLARFSLTR